jgi:hypothetical protein
MMKKMTLLFLMIFISLFARSQGIFIGYEINEIKASLDTVHNVKYLQEADTLLKAYDITSDSLITWYSFDKDGLSDKVELMFKSKTKFDAYVGFLDNKFNRIAESAWMSNSKDLGYYYIVTSTSDSLGGMFRFRLKYLF